IMHQINSLRQNLQLYRYIRDCLARRESISVATIISRTGSGPREAGATIVLTENGNTLGTVGGGLLEAATLEMAKSAILNHRPEIRTFFLTDKEAGENGMICGGQVEILVDYLDGCEPVYQKIMEALLQHGEKGIPCWIVKSIYSLEKSGELKTGLGLIDEIIFQTGSLYIDGLDEEALRQQCRKEPSLYKNACARYFVQQIDVPETVFIFGAGHVGQELAAICSFVGFRTVVIDDRQEFANVERFPSADEIIILDSFGKTFPSLTVNPQSYIVIVTRGHAYDQSVLSWALSTSTGYIGMIASRRKREIIFQALLDNGASQENLAGIHSPIGLDIGARTPAEIAVSIAAELISVRAGQEKRKAGS
ncbi:MAG: XdhC family aldehyde oxidoreductase maturation factor, partial [Smithella sp.]